MIGNEPLPATPFKKVNDAIIHKRYEPSVTPKPPTTVHLRPILEAIIPPNAKPKTLPNPPIIVLIIFDPDSAPR